MVQIKELLLGAYESEGAFEAVQRMLWLFHLWQPSCLQILLFCHLAGGAMPRGGFSLDGNLHLHSWEIIGQGTAIEEVFEELCTW